MVQIIPAILSTSKEDFQRDISRYTQAFSFKEGWIHIDFMDNVFVPNLSIEPELIVKHPIDLQKEAHLMVSHPLQWVDKLVAAGFEKIIFHIEAEDDILKCIESIKDKKVEVGLAINNETPIEKLEPFVDKIDIVLVMSVKPGFQGQLFIPGALDKVARVKSLNRVVSVGVDGAVSDTNVKEIIESGVDFLVVGSYLLNGDIDENLEKLWEVINV